MDAEKDSKNFYTLPPSEEKKPGANEKIQSFCLRFFEKLGAEIKFLSGYYVINKVPESFEKFFGKQSPYFFAFSGGNFPKEVEMINQGNHLIKSINGFLEGSGETTLVKLNIDVDPVSELEKRFNLKNCEISKVNKKISYSVFLRFTFVTTLQYLNEKEQLTNVVFVKDNNIFDFNEDLYKGVDGNKKDIGKVGAELDYRFAQERLKEIIFPKVQEVSGSLSHKLEREIKRINEHFEIILGEHSKTVDDLKKNISKLEIERDRVEGEELDSVNERLLYLKKNLKNLLEKEEIKNSEKEKVSLVSNEKQKHSLNVKNKLINTGIYYYPVFNFEYYLKFGKKQKIVMLDFDIFNQTSFELKCDSCNVSLGEVIVCNGGHLTCRICGERCGSCSDICCALCLKRACSLCGKKICDSCAVRCGNCGKFFCKEHLTKDRLSGKILCENCIGRCANCGQIFGKDSLKVDLENGRDLCDKCRLKEVGRKTLKGIFEE